MKVSLIVLLARLEEGAGDLRVQDLVQNLHDVGVLLVHHRLTLGTKHGEEITLVKAV